MNTKNSEPSDFLKGLTHYWKSDVLSGFFVFLLAMPLSLGIAKASDFPVVSGLLTAIIGGVIVSLIAGSKLTIKGPAAGLIVICAGAVHDFGGGHHGWQLALGAIVIAGVVQIIFGLLKLGTLSDFFPVSVIHGMLAAIGLIILSKQIHTLIGDNPLLLKGLTPIELLERIPESLLILNPPIAFIGFLCLIIVFGLPLIKNKYIKLIPSPVVILLVSIPLGVYFDFKNTGPDFALIKLGHFSDVLQINVDFGFDSQNVNTLLKYVFLFSIIGTVESLLTVKAIDGLDTYKRKSNYNLDIIAVGIGNIVAGIFGGLPMISEVARSTSNVSNGAVTRWSNFFHGFFMLLAVLFIPFLIEMIPNTALAAMLIGVGYKLASPKEFIKTYKIGIDQLIIFCTTIIFTLLDDLLVGVLAGIAVKLVISSLNGIKLSELFIANVHVIEQDNTTVLQVRGAAVFSNILSFKKIKNQYKDANLVIDFSHCKFIDHTFMDYIHHLEGDFHDLDKNIKIKGFENHHFISSHPLCARIMVNNPLTKKLFTLNKMQENTKHWVETKGWEYEPTVSKSIVRIHLNNFHFFKYVTKIKNFISGTTPTFGFSVGDFSMSEGALVTKQDFEYSIMYVYNTHFNIPDLLIEPKSEVGLLQHVFGNDSIVYTDNNLFNTKYTVSGNDHQAILAFLQDDKMQLLLNNTETYIQVKNANVILHTYTKFKYEIEYEQQLEFMKSILG